MRASLDSGCLVLTAGAGCGKTIAVLERARALWAGEPLPEERYSDWATAYREALIDRSRPF